MPKQHTNTFYSHTLAQFGAGNAQNRVFTHFCLCPKIISLLKRKSVNGHISANIGPKSQFEKKNKSKLDLESVCLHMSYTKTAQKCSKVLKSAQKPSNGHISAKKSRKIQKKTKISRAVSRKKWPQKSFLLFWVQRTQKWPYLGFFLFLPPWPPLGPPLAPLGPPPPAIL